MSAMSRIDREKKAHELFTRFDGNPILKAEDWPYAANAVFNPGAARLDGQTLLLAASKTCEGFLI